MTNKTKIKHQRKSIRLPAYDYSSPRWYFVTICTSGHKCIYGEVVNEKMVLNDVGEIVNHWWNRLAIRYDNIELDTHQIMPNHIHGISLTTNSVGGHHNVQAHPHNVWAHPHNVRAHHDAPLRGKTKRGDKRALLPQCIGFFKMNSTKKIRNFANKPNMGIWRRNYYEHIIRNEKSLHEIRQYITNNPVKWHLDEYYVEKPEVYVAL